MRPCWAYRLSPAKYRKQWKRSLCRAKTLGKEQGELTNKITAGDVPDAVATEDKMHRLR